MELAAGHVVLGDEGGDRAAIIGARHERRQLVGNEVIGVHEISVEPALAGRDAVEQRVRARYAQRVPAHMRDLERRISGRRWR